MKVFLTLLAGMTGLATSFAAPKDPLPSEWRPDLTLVEEVVERFYGGDAQQGMNLRTGRVFEIRDAELALAYLRLYGALPSKEQDVLKNEQTKWLKYRDDEVDKITPKDSARGTIAPMEENIRATDLTEARIKELEARLAKLR